MPGRGRAQPRVSSKIQLKGLIVDFGGVLTTPPEEAFASFCRLHQIAPELLAKVLAIETTGPVETLTLPHRVEVGEISQHEFDRYLAESLSAGRASPLEAEGLSNQIMGELRPVPAMVLAVRRLRETGVLTALLSNSWGQDYPMQALSMMFDQVVISAKVGLRKPQPEIYLLTADLLHLHPRECVFVDDVPANVAAADALGMIGIVHKSPEVTLDILERLFQAGGETPSNDWSHL